MALLRVAEIPARAVVGFFDDGDGVLSGSERVNIEYLEVSYGGGNNVATVFPYSAVTLDNVTVRDSLTSGFYTSASSPLITNCVAVNNGEDGLELTGAGTPEIRDCVIDGNRDSGIHVVSTNTTPIIADNEITNNADWGILFDGAPSAPPITGNTIRNNQLLAYLPPRAIPEVSMARSIETSVTPAATG